MLFLQFLQKIHSDSALNRIDLLLMSRSIPRMKNFPTKSSQKSFKVTKKFKTYTYHFIVQLINYPQSVHNMYECDKRVSKKTHISATLFIYLVIKHNNVCGIWNTSIRSFVQANIIFFNRLQNLSHLRLKAFNGFFDTFIRCFFIFNWKNYPFNTNWSILFRILKLTFMDHSLEIFQKWFSIWNNTAFRLIFFQFHFMIFNIIFKTL